MAAATWQQANGAKECEKRTAKNGQKQTAQKCENERKSAKTAVENRRKKCETDRGAFC